MMMAIYSMTKGLIEGVKLQNGAIVEILRKKDEMSWAAVRDVVSVHLDKHIAKLYSNMANLDDVIGASNNTVTEMLNNIGDPTFLNEYKPQNTKVSVGRDELNIGLIIDDHFAS
jgi:hypothetical protein